ncbi:MAG: hypothetical protein Q9P44_13375 [Anaerolineae bacterium]|nr:hypothetical protein [Anaerolineae bacterium]
MAEKSLKYLSGRGWLVLSGGHTSGSPIRAQALARARAYGATAYISLADDSGDALMDDLEDLGARSGYFVDLEYDTPEEMKEQLEAASFIVIEVGSSIDALYHALKQEAVMGIRAAYERGAVILIEGLAANLFGRWILSDGGDLLEGLNWLENTFIEPESSGIADSRAVQMVMTRISDAIAVNIMAGSALVLGSDNQVEVWGQENSVTISLGRSFSSE